MTRKRLASLMAAVVVLATAAPLFADVLVNPFAGSWGTFGNTGTLNLQVVDAGKGAAAVSFYSGGSAATLCPPPTGGRCAWIVRGPRG